MIVDTLKSISLTNRDEIDEMFHRLQAFIHACKRQMLHKSDTDVVQVGLEEQSYLQHWVKQLLDDSQVRICLSRAVSI